MTEEKIRLSINIYQLVKKVVYNMLRDEGFSEDVCQEVFLAFLDKADTMEAKYYKQWLLVNGKRKAIDFASRIRIYETTASTFRCIVRMKMFLGFPTEMACTSLRKMR